MYGEWYIKAKQFQLANDKSLREILKEFNINSRSDTGNRISICVSALITNPSVDIKELFIGSLDTDGLFLSGYHLYYLKRTVSTVIDKVNKGHMKYDEVFCDLKGTDSNSLTTLDEFFSLLTRYVKDKL